MRDVQLLYDCILHNSSSSNLFREATNVQWKKTKDSKDYRAYRVKPDILEFARMYIG